MFTGDVSLVYSETSWDFFRSENFLTEIQSRVNAYGNLALMLAEIYILVSSYFDIKYGF